MEKFEIKSIDRDEKITMIGRNKERLQLGGFEANFVSVIRDYPAETRIRLMQLSEKDCLLYFKNKRQSYREYALELLSKKWYCRETDMRFTLKHFDCDFLEGCPSFQKVKEDVKKDKYSIAELNKIIGHFTADYSEFYLKD